MTKSKIDKIKNYPIDNAISYLCEIYPNDQELGYIIRRYFKKKND